MNNAVLLWIGFALLVTAQLFVPSSMIFEREKIIQEGSQFLFRTEPVDPLDAFRGRYIYLRFSNTEIAIDSTFQVERNSVAFITFKTDTAGFALVDGVFFDKPEDEDNYLKVAIDEYWYSSDSILRIEFPFNRYYMEEMKAPIAETAYNEANRNPNLDTWAVVSILDGEAVLTNVMIDGVNIEEVVAQRN